MPVGGNPRDANRDESLPLVEGETAKFLPACKGRVQPQI